MATTYKRGNEIPTIDVALVTMEVSGQENEIALDTASTIEVNPTSETEDAVQLIVKGRLIAQKPSNTTVTGNTITLTDNVFNPEMVKILQGGTIKYWSDAEHGSKTDTDAGFGVASYKPPVAGSAEKGTVFKLHAYSSIYNAAGIITGYEKISYPNCQGTPVFLNTEDGNSAPTEDEAPYEIIYVDELPTVTKG